MSFSGLESRRASSKVICRAPGPLGTCLALYFERFLNPERVSMPDIDMDFGDARRDEVVDYVRRKYGED